MIMLLWKLMIGQIERKAKNSKKLHRMPYGFSRVHLVINQNHSPHLVTMRKGVYSFLADQGIQCIESQLALARPSIGVISLHTLFGKKYLKSKLLLFNN